MILCFGNPLHGDDAFGWHVFTQVSQYLDEIESREQAPIVKFGGSSPLDAVTLLEGVDYAVIVDARLPNGQPGRVEQARVTGVKDAPSFLSLHRFSIADALAAMQAEGIALPVIDLISVEAHSIDTFTLELSPRVAAAVEPVSSLALQLATDSQQMEMA